MLKQSIKDTCFYGIILKINIIKQQLNVLKEMVANSYKEVLTRALLS